MKICIKLPGVSLSLSKRGLRPKLYCGVLFNRTFSGEYVPGAVKIALLHYFKKIYNLMLVLINTWCIHGLLGGSLASQTVLWTFI